MESLNATYPYYLARLGGGLLVLVGMLLMLVNMLKTFQMARDRTPHPVLAPDPAEARQRH